ncbi:MAG: leucyl aminopeptidase [Candidatus Puniceispirillaceae bacterium]
MSAHLSIKFAPLSEAIISVVLMDESLEGLSGTTEEIAQIKDMSQAASFTGKKGQSYMHLFQEDGHMRGVLAIGVGADLSDKLVAETVGASVYKGLKGHKITQANLKDCQLSDEVMMAVLYGAMSQSYEFNEYFTKKDKTDVTELGIVHDRAVEFETQFSNVLAMLNGIYLARDLITEPANILHPEAFADRCLALRDLGLEIEVLDEAAMTKMGMGALLGVGQGSRRQSQMVIMKWQGGGSEAPLAYVGKGVCFDTGGISLKPAKGMEDMKWDMGGAAAVTGAMCAIAGRKVARNVVGIIGLVENMPDGNAQRPGDVVTSLSGQTIEVINTDAEGRLVLADCLTYCQQTFKPQMIVDLATLTGAIIVALGKEYAGLFSNDEHLTKKIQSSGEAMAEPCWPMPIGQSYHDMLKSHIADMKNIGGPWGGAITAACFLEKFIDDGTPWAHLDIAGKAWADKAGHAHPSGGTGFGVRLLNDLADKWDS